MKELKAIAGIIIAVVMLGIAGRCDYNEEVIYSMSEGTYKAIKAELGENVTDTKLVDVYQENKHYWDSVGKAWEE
jgi:hypothetical protein